ncbi:hypothetical protein [Thalassobaculum fulvum]|nr:hypothetical protein [Thalassobaculum fulvum]
MIWLVVGSTIQLHSILSVESCDTEMMTVGGSFIYIFELMASPLVGILTAIANGYHHGWAFWRRTLSITTTIFALSNAGVAYMLIDAYCR